MQRASVTADQVPDLLVATSSWVADAWHEVAEENEATDSPGGRLGYLDAGWIVGRLAERTAAGDTEGFRELFGLVERMVVDGDTYVHELAVIGYLEGMQMQTVTSRGVDPQVFRAWMGPESLRYWEAINAFWESGTPIPDLRSD